MAKVLYDLFNTGGHMSEHVVNFNKCAKQPRVPYEPNPKFGTVFGSHLLRLNFTSETKSFDAEIVPFGPEMMSPATAALHYGQSIFEGLKAYRQKDGSVAVFRADLHAARFNKSAQIMALPPVPEDVFMKCLMEYMKLEQDSVPSEPDHSLYLRPLQFGRDAIIKLGPSKTTTFYIMSAIAGRYFSATGVTPAKVLVNKTFTRAFPGGTGEAKTAGNYAASLFPQSVAMKFGCDQVLYLDAAKHETVDELGGMNFFIVRGNELVTPYLSGAILHGVTRRSVLELAETLGFKAKEEPISFTQLLSDLKSGKVTECFACGTAATVHPIGSFFVQTNVNSQPEVFELPQKFPVALKMLETLSAVQRGQIAAPGKWLFKV